jgi:hypothetical protein
LPSSNARLRVTHGAAARLVVPEYAQAQGELETSNAKSVLPEGLMPALVAPAKKPLGRVMEAV